MTEREEIDMLRRAVAALEERVRALEARPTIRFVEDTRHSSDPSRITITPMRGPIYGPAGDPNSSGTPMPQRFPATCAARQDGSTSLPWLAESRGEV